MLFWYPVALLDLFLGPGVLWYILWDFVGRQLYNLPMKCFSVFFINICRSWVFCCLFHNFQSRREQGDSLPHSQSLEWIFQSLSIYSAAYRFFTDDLSWVGKASLFLIFRVLTLNIKFVRRPFCVYKDDDIVSALQSADVAAYTCSWTAHHIQQPAWHSRKTPHLALMHQNQDILLHAIC